MNTETNTATTTKISQEVKIISSTELLNYAQMFKNDNCRLIHIGAAKIADKFELTYAFDKEYTYSGIKVIIDIPSDGSNENNKIIPELNSISDFFWCAFLYENEIAELFGIKFNGLKLDYKGNFYKTAFKTPFNNPMANKKIDIIRTPKK
ncbi:MAG: NADH-quinone oxidoreductase subunit C [Oligoflexia bacterium]|nr:NADH-quinone oxidoreductase subunit C [Oligoflexia bacterium]